MPVTVIEEPGVAEPGWKVPPLAMLVLPTVPVPVSAPLLTVVNDDDAIEPFTSALPPSIVVAPV